MGIKFSDMAVLESPGLAFIIITNQVFRFFTLLINEAPFHSCWKTSSTTTLESGFLHLIGNLIGCKRFQCLLNGHITS